MLKKTIFTSLILIITLQTTSLWAETKAFKLSVTIPVIVGINDQHSPLSKTMIKQTSNIITQEAKIVRQNTPMIMRSIVVL